MARYALRLFSIAFAACFAACFAAVTYLRDAIIDALTSLTRIAFDLYQPSARETLDLNRLVAPVAVLPKARSRFLAFVDRLRTHADYSAGHFDPGRMAA